MMNMKKIFTYILAATAAVMTFAACDLDLVPNSSIAYEEGGVLIQTANNLKSFENGINASFRSYQMGEFQMAEEFMLDGFNACVDYGNNYGGIHSTDYNFTSADYYVEDFWSYSYTGIKNFNIMIANADNCPEDLLANAMIAKGEAYFFRAATYLNLARHFGKAYSANASTDLCVPLVLVYDQNEKPARATVKEVYDQIKADLDQAANLLKDVKGSVNAKKPTIDAVNALYARYYIDIKDYANAAAAAHKVIDSGTYKLATTLDEMTETWVNDNGTEAILQQYASLTESTNASNYWTLETTDETYKTVFRSYYIPTANLVNAYEASDIRFGAWFDNTTVAMQAGSYYEGKFYTFIKYWGNPALVSSPIRNGRIAPKVLMIGEMYLIAAEAEAAANQSSAAITDLNALQTARGASTTAATTENIQKEWLRETVGEGLRMSCLKRWGIGFSNRTCQAGAYNAVNHGQGFDEKSLPASSFYYQWPIPSHEMKINKNLVQNEGYDTTK